MGNVRCACGNIIKTKEAEVYISCRARQSGRKGKRAYEDEAAKGGIAERRVAELSGNPG